MDSPLAISAAIFLAAVGVVRPAYRAERVVEAAELCCGKACCCLNENQDKK